MAEVREDSTSSILVVVRHSPYGSTLGRTAIDTALAAAAFEQPVSLLFLGDGVLNLMPDQNSEGIGIKNMGKLLASLPLYDIGAVYADTEAARRYRVTLEDSPVPVKPLNKQDIRNMLARHKSLLGF